MGACEYNSINTVKFLYDKGFSIKEKNAFGKKSIDNLNR